MESSEKIEELALNTLKETQMLNNSSEIDVIGVAIKLGFVVGNAVLDEADDGFIVVQEGRNEIFGIKTDRLIGVNSNRSLEWKRFVVAHEIGHYVLEYKLGKMAGLYAHRDHERGHDDSENEVDFFAANLLMPREQFVKKFNLVTKEFSGKQEIINELAKYFVVTPRMSERRIEELGLH